MRCKILVWVWIGVLALSNFASSKGTNLTELPFELQWNIFSFLSEHELRKLPVVSKGTKAQFQSDEFYFFMMWKKSIYEALRSTRFKKQALDDLRIPDRRVARLSQLLKPETNFAFFHSGQFQMGTPESQIGRTSDEVLHWVKHANFLIQKEPVTQLLWYMVMGTNPSEFKEKHHCPSSDYLEVKDPQNKDAPATQLCIRNPVENVSWLEIVNDFLPKLQKLGIYARLPTEAEWERAAGEVDFFGMTPENQVRLKEYAWFFEVPQEGQEFDGHTFPISLKKATPSGLSDVYGNVMEWTQDIYLPYPEAIHSEEAWLDHPRIDPPEGEFHVVRGGSWNMEADGCRTGARSYFRPKFQRNFIGFRLAMDAPSTL
jgi:formylglycine-generating enzyme